MFKYIKNTLARGKIMQYRKLGNSDIDVSALGFGCMRFPTPVKGYENVPPPERPIMEDETEKMILYAIENGINYFDTAYMYHGGNSEKFLGRVLKPYRDKVMIATKLPSMLVKEPSDIEKFTDEQFERLGTDYFDFYLLHGLNRPSWSFMKEHGALDFLERLKSEGRIRYTGFSFHDDVKIFKEIVDAYDWTMCQIQYNYFDENRQAGREGLEYAAGKGMGVVIMEPLRGGNLAIKVPPAVREIWDSAKIKRTPAEYGLRWVLNHPEVSLVLSGMSAMPQLVENIKTAEDAKAGSLKEEELALIGRAKKIYEEMLKIDCTGCAYCMPCPNGVDIPTNFNLYNDYFMFDETHRTVMMYNNMLSPDQRASNCEECGECEEKCPQQIDTMNELQKVHSLLGRSEEM